MLKAWLMVSFSQAQPVGDIMLPGKDTAQRYVSIYPIKITPHVYLSDRSLGLTFKRHSTARGKRIEYAPNQTLSIGIGANFGKLELAIGFRLPASDRQLDKYGRTRSLDLRLNSYGDKFGVDGYLQSYRGFYIRRGYERRTPDESVRPQFPQLRAFHWEETSTMCSTTGGFRTVPSSRRPNGSCIVPGPGWQWGQFPICYQKPAFSDSRSGCGPIWSRNRLTASLTL